MNGCAGLLGVSFRCVLFRTREDRRHRDQVIANRGGSDSSVRYGVIRGDRS
jgi:hypothetical protein